LGGPRHPYTVALMHHSPSIDADGRARREPLRGAPVPPIDPGPGCLFANRCPHAVALCQRETPELRPVGSRLLAACHLLHWATETGGHHGHCRHSQGRS
jgi:oligopeptide/dipeptide ABC transporter ATP-binding protein